MHNIVLRQLDTCEYSGFTKTTKFYKCETNVRITRARDEIFYIINILKTVLYKIYK